MTQSIRESEPAPSLAEGSPHVLFEDARWLVLHKPAWLPTTSPDEHEATLARWARTYAKGAEIVHPTSRLDVGVTGICVFALTKSVNRAVLEARERGDYRRTYVALANPRPSLALGPASSLPARGERQGEGKCRETDEAFGTGPSGIWDAAIAVHPQDPKRRVVVVPGRRARPPVMSALTEWQLIARADGIVLLSLRPKTGRTHQLRVHASAAGMPLLGDVTYGGARRITRPDGGIVGMSRPALHCARVRIHCGAEIGVLEVGSPVPSDMRDAWRAFGGDDGALDV